MPTPMEFQLMQEQKNMGQDVPFIPEANPMMFDPDKPLSSLLKQALTGALGDAVYPANGLSVPGNQTGDVLKSMGANFVKAIPKSIGRSFKNAALDYFLSKIPLPGDATVAQGEQGGLTMDIPNVLGGNLNLEGRKGYGGFTYSRPF